MNHASFVRTVLRTDPLRWHLLDVVRRLDLPDSWIGAGFIRNAVWDRLHGRQPCAPSSDVNVIWYDPARSHPAWDEEYEAALSFREPCVVWSVKNQSRMHVRNGDAPYTSSIDAIRHWPETATAVAARRSASDGCEIAAPLGMDDLIALIIRPTPAFSSDKRDIYEARIRDKNWTKSWPRLQLLAP